LDASSIPKGVKMTETEQRPSDPKSEPPPARPKGRSWTLGDSAAIGGEPAGESTAVTMAWIVGPIVLLLVLFSLMS
jgi:hypothetical protein